VLNCGGNWNNAGKAGLWYLNGNNDASNSNSNIGARLSFLSLVNWRERPLQEIYVLAPWQKTVVKSTGQ